MVILLKYSQNLKGTITHYSLPTEYVSKSSFRFMNCLASRNSEIKIQGLRGLSLILLYPPSVPRFGRSLNSGDGGS